jgi:ureidoacrylate peracid hydrolase
MANERAKIGDSVSVDGSNSAQLSPEITALLVIDPVNDFLSEGGAAWDLTKTTVKKNDVVANLKRLMEGARRRGIPVLLGPMAYTAEDYESQHWQRRSGINRIMFERKMFLAGSWGADFHPDLQPQPSDIVLKPHKGTDVFETDLPEHLERLGSEHLVIAGMTANLCCESTGRHAIERGFDVTFISDAIGAENLPAYEASIRINYPLIGNAVLTVDEFFQAVDGAASGALTVEVGNLVRGSDHMEVGRVEAVAAPDAEQEGYLLVRRGTILTRDTYIPLDAVVSRSGETVFINVPKLVVGKMPWDAPPAKGAQRQKYGPPAAGVDKLYRSHGPSPQP